MFSEPDAPAAGAASPASLSGMQQLAVEFRGRALAVVGAAGSGKSVAAVARVEALVAEGVPPEQILVLSPSRQPARRLRDALSARIGVSRSGPWARTPQSLAFDVVRAASRSRSQAPARLLTGGEQEQIIGELLAGHAAAGRGPQWPTTIGPEVRALRGFRHELRDVIDQVSEYGVEPEALAAAGRDEWRAVAEFLREYRQVLAAFDPVPFSAPELVGRAVAELEAQVQAREEGRPFSWWEPVAHVIVDDSQELTEMTVRLLRVLSASGASVVSFGDPDTATTEFRGGRPEFASTLPEQLGFPAEPLVFDTVFRSGSEVHASMGRITSAIGAARGGPQRRAWLHTPITGREGKAQVATFASTSHEHAGIAARLRRRHLVEAVPWSELAVVVRSTSAIAGLVRALEVAGVPARASGRPELFSENVATEPLITAGAVACGVLPGEPSTYLHLLGSYLGGMDAVSVRRLRRVLRAEERASGGHRSADELLAEAFEVDAGFASLDPWVGGAAHAFRKRLAAAREVAQHGTADEVLWSFWDSTRVDDGTGRLGRVDEVWRDKALGTGPDASALSRNLDAVVALFATASRVVEQSPDAPASEFFADQLTRRVADDIIAPAAEIDSVWVGTPAQLIGQEFDTVVISGVQDGVWPDMRLRDTLLGAGQIGSLGLSTGPTDYLDRRREVLHSELRLFARAVSRARALVLVTAVDGEDESPSALLSLIDPRLRDGPAEPCEVEVHPFTLRGLAGQLRRQVAVGGDDVDAAVAGLGALAAEGVPGAHPRDWHGLAQVSVDAPIHEVGPENPVPVSPSAIDSFEQCPLHWFLDRFGANNAGATAAVGTIVHGALEQQHGPADKAELAEYIDSRWGELVFDAGWESSRQRARVDVMLDKLVAYLREAEQEGRTRVAAEVRFSDRHDAFELRGSIDRIEKTGDGELLVVDLKTGTRVPTVAEMAENPQLASYQLAIVDGLPGADPELGEAVRTAAVHEGRLVFVGDSAQRVTQRIQAAFSEDDLQRFRQRLTDVALGMAAADFMAHTEQHCLGTASAQCAIHLIPAVTE